MQLSPHTLFNLLLPSGGRLGGTRSRTGDVVQLVICCEGCSTPGSATSRVDDELRFVRLYLELQQKRFADRLTIWMADLDGIPALWVPSLILQPLIENAVVHGLAGHNAPWRFELKSACAGRTWCCG